MFTQIDYTMVVVSDMARSVAFYRDLLGIPLKFESPDWTEFLTGTTTLALHGGGLKSESVRTGKRRQVRGDLLDWLQRRRCRQNLRRAESQRREICHAAHPARRRRHQTRCLHRSGRLADRLRPNDRTGSRGRRITAICFVNLSFAAFVWFRGSQVCSARTRFTKSHEMETKNCTKEVVLAQSRCRIKTQGPMVLTSSATACAGESLPSVYSG